MTGVLSAQSADGYGSQSEVVARMKNTALRPIEGLWRFPSSGTVIAIERDGADTHRFRVVAVESRYALFSNGEVLGYVTPTVKRDVYEARLRELRGDGGSKKQHGGSYSKFILTMTDGDALTFKPIKKGLKVRWDWWRLFPYMFRFRVDKVDERPEGLEGAVKLWPRRADVPPRYPRYL